jgi:molecular chaperone GrpE
MGEMFDPHVHEAIAQQPTAEQPAGCVIDVTQVGYQLHDRVIRPTQVVVSTGIPEENPEDTNEKAEEQGD